MGKMENLVDGCDANRKRHWEKVWRRGLRGDGRIGCEGFMLPGGSEAIQRRLGSEMMWRTTS